MQYVFHRLIDAPTPDVSTPPPETLGGDVFACSQQSFVSNEAGDFKFSSCFGDDDSKYWKVENVSVDAWYWAKFYTPEAMTLVSIELQTNEGLNAPAKVRLYGGSSESSYDLISDVAAFEGAKIISLQLNSSVKPCKFYKLEVQPANAESFALSVVRYRGVMIQSLGAYFVNDDKSIQAYAPFIQDNAL